MTVKPTLPWTSRGGLGGSSGRPSRSTSVSLRGREERVLRVGGPGASGRSLLAALALSGFFAFSALPVVARAQSTVDVVLNGVAQITYTGPILRLSVGDAKMAEISALGQEGVLIKGKQLGSTVLMVWGRDGSQGTYSIQVVPDAERIDTEMREIFAGERVEVRVSGQNLILRGQVSGPQAMEAISSWVESYRSGLGKAGKRLRVLNQLTLPPRQQVQLEVRFAEVSRRGMRKLGMSLIGSYQDNMMGVFTPESGFPAMSDRTLPFPRDSLPTPSAESMGILFFADPTSSFPFHALLNVLSSRGLSKTLSEPTLVALSGQKANFLVGGEFPVPIPLGLNQVSIEYKKFGVQLDFQPVVLKDETIQMDVQTVVSDLDSSRTFKLGGHSLPSLTTRSSSTTVRLRNGQSFAIAGLLSDKLLSRIDKVPLLGDIPILGMLFRAKHFQREESELVVVITARLVEPMSSRSMPPLPGDGYLADPSDFELFLMGWGDVEHPVKSGRGRGRGSRPASHVGFRK